MIVKVLSRHENVDQLIKYVLQDCKMNPASTKETAKPIRVKGVHLSEADIKHLYAERADSQLLKEFKDSEFNGNVKEFVAKYIADNLKKEDNAKDELSGVLIRHNMRARSIQGFVTAFKENEKHRRHVRNNSVKAYHHIISFSELDKNKIDEGMLKDITQKYISLRGENSLYVGAVHRDKEHVHIHLVQSGTQYCTGLANRVSKQEFQHMKVKLQEYQKEHYPELANSMPNHKREKTRSKYMNTEKKQNAERGEEQKTALAAFLLTAFERAVSKEAFLDEVIKNGHEPYYRNGKLQGVKYEGEKKFRFTTLGIRQVMDVVNQKIEKEQAELKEIQQLRTGRSTRNIELAPDNTKTTDNPNTYEQKIQGRSDDQVREVQQDMLDQSRSFEEENNIDTSSNPVRDEAYERRNEREQLDRDDELEL